MKVIAFAENQKSEYQNFVRANGNFLQDWDWGEFQKSLGRKVVRLGLFDNDELVLTAQMIFNKARNKIYIYIPYGPVQQNPNQQTMSWFFDQIAQKHPECIFIRFESHFPVNLDQKKFRKSIDLNPHKTLVLNLSKDADTLLKEMHNKTRYNIKVAIKHSVQVKIATEFSEQAKEIFRETSTRAGVRFQEGEYLAEMLKFFGQDKNIAAKLYVGEYEGDTLAANLMIFWNKTVIYLFGGSSSENRNVMAPYLLHWQAIQDAKNLGLEKYDFWGVEEDLNHPWFGFSRFKLGFGGEVVKYAGTIDYILHPAWYNAYTLLRKLNRIVRK